MQILTYVDSSLAMQAVQETDYHSLLKNHLNKSRKTERNFDLNLEEAKDVVKSVAVKFGIFAKKNKILMCSLAAVYLLAIFVPVIVSAISVAVEKAHMSVFTQVDETLLDGAMKKFAFSENYDSVDDEGFISNSGSKLQYAVENVTFKKYVVQNGDNITKITKKFGLSNISSIISVNGITNDRSLMAGKSIKIPSVDGIMYAVKSGDSLASVAKRYGLTSEALLDINDLSSSTLKVGQQLFIPGACLDTDTLKQTLGTAFICPIKAKWRLSSPYGYRADPFTGVRKFHTGMDLACPTGTPVYAAMEGKIIEVSYNSVYGNYIVIRHSNGYQTVYAHLSAFNVTKGQSVSQGAKIALVGSTGYSTGPHLHFMIYKNGKLQNPQSMLK